MSPQTPIYVDNHATTPVDERVLQDMLPFLTDHFGNAASRTHSYGWKAESAVDRAREQVAETRRRWRSCGDPGDYLLQTKFCWLLPHGVTAAPKKLDFCPDPGDYLLETTLF